jgi:hypothetical protein
VFAAASSGVRRTRTPCSHPLFTTSPAPPAPHQLNGYEYFFGGGIQRERPALVTANTGLAPVERQRLGVTAKTEVEVAAFLRSPAMAQKYVPERYDLFTNNCNHFSNDLAVFLTGAGIPDAIMRLPERVQQSPMGAMVLQMWRGASAGGGGAAGGGDPLSGAFRAGSGGGTPLGGAFPAARGGGAAAAGTAAAGAAAAPAPALAAPAATAPAATDFPDASGAAIVGARVAKAAGEPGAHAAFSLGAEDVTLLASLGAALAEPPPAAWAGRACELAARLLAPGVPAEKGAFPGALLARLLALRSDCAAHLVAPGGAVDALLRGLASDPPAWTIPGAVNQALQACANALCGERGRVWVGAAGAPVPALVAVVARELRSGEREDCRRLAAAIGANLAIAGGGWGDGAAGGGAGGAGGGGGAGASGAGAGDAAPPEWALPLLLALLEGVAAERSAEVARKRLQAADWLLRAPRFADGTLRALAASVDAAAPLQKFADAPAGPADLRALARQVLASL